MSRSSLLRVVDIRAIFDLVGECRELGDDPAGWRRHLLAGVARLAGAAVTKYESVFLDPFRLACCIEGGWETSGLDRAVFLSIQEEQPADTSPRDWCRFPPRFMGMLRCWKNDLPGSAMRFRLATNSTARIP